MRTCLSSFSISPALITSGPRTAYSILITFGFNESNVSVRLVDVDIVLRSLSVNTEFRMPKSVFDWLLVRIRLRLNCRQLVVTSPRFNKVFKHRLLIIFIFSCSLIYEKKKIVFFLFFRTNSIQKIHKNTLNEIGM